MNLFLMMIPCTKFFLFRNTHGFHMIVSHWWQRPSISFVCFCIEQMSKVSLFQFMQSKGRRHFFQGSRHKIKAIHKTKMQSMQNFHVHDLTSIINTFVSNVLLYTIIHNELKIISLTIMGNHCVSFMFILNQPFAESMDIGEIILFSVSILCHHKICFVYSCLLHGFNIKEYIIMIWCR